MKPRQSYATVLPSQSLATAVLILPQTGHTGLNGNESAAFCAPLILLLISLIFAALSSAIRIASLNVPSLYFSLVL